MQHTCLNENGQKRWIPVNREGGREGSTLGGRWTIPKSVAAPRRPELKFGVMEDGDPGIHRHRFRFRDSEIQRCSDRAPESGSICKYETKRNFPFRLKNVIKSPANEHKRLQPTNQPASERASDHKTKQANFQLILTRSTKAKTGNGHGPWPKRLEDLGPGWPRRTRLCNYESKCESERPRLERNPFPTFSRTSNFNWQ